MKKIFTFGIFLLLLVGIGNIVSAATITAVVPLVDNSWTNVNNWVGGVVPTYLDDVIIPATDSLATSATAYCNSLTVGGTFYNGGTFYVNGTITVNSGGTFNIHSNMYCYNISNSGKFWNPSQPYSGSPKNLFLGCGFTFTAPSTYANVYGTGDYVIQNDGMFGSTRAQAVAKIGGSGIYIYYSNLASSVTIQPSSPSVTNNTFNIGALAPFTNTTTASSQNFTLNIKESIALFRYSTVLGFSLQNGEASAGFSRTCNIFAGDTVFVAGYFHTKGSQPTTNQGDITYNINGCLDIATYHPSSVNEIDLWSTNFVGNTNSLKINVGDGTPANAGTLILGVVTSLKKALSGQTVGIFPSTYSTVKFGYTVAAPTITSATAGVTDNTLFPSTFNNLAITNTALGIAVTLPNNPSVSGSLSLTNALSNTVTLNGTAAQTIDGQNQTVTGLTINNPQGASIVSPLTVSGALTLTDGKINLGTANLTIGAAGSISGGTTGSYVVTNGTGKLTQTAATTGTLFPIGTATGYAPATITPAAAVAIAASVSATTTGTYTGYAVNANEWTLTPATATNAALALTPTTATNTTSPVIFSGVASGNYAATTAATVSGSTFTASGISLAAVATPFATGGTTTATAVETNTKSNLLVYSTKNSLIVKNAKAGDLITVYGVSGLKVASSVVSGDNTILTLTPGIYIVKAGTTVQKVSVQ